MAPISAGNSYRCWWRPVLIAAALAFVMLAAGPRPVLAQADQGATDATTPVEEFSREVDKLKKTFADLGKKIDQSAKSIDTLSDAAQARKELDDLRATVSDLLGTVSDNGAVAELGAKALDHAHHKLDELQHETKFSADEQQFLIAEWRKLADQTQQASNDLAAARGDFANLLRLLQTREDYIDELLQIRRASDAINVMRELSQNLRDASSELRKLIDSIKTPGV